MLAEIYVCMTWLVEEKDADGVLKPERGGA
jgi:hypothetical protein